MGLIGNNVFGTSKVFWMFVWCTCLETTKGRIKSCTLFAPRLRIDTPEDVDDDADDDGDEEMMMMTKGRKEEEGKGEGEQRIKQPQPEGWRIKPMTMCENT